MVIEIEIMGIIEIMVIERNIGNNRNRNNRNNGNTKNNINNINNTNNTDDHTEVIKPSMTSPETKNPDPGRSDTIPLISVLLWYLSIVQARKVIWSAVWLYKCKILDMASVFSFP